MVSEVEFDPAPATTGTRLFTVLTVNSITRWCSSWDSVADSPVVPQGTITSVPLLIWNSIRSPSAFSSTLPFLNGVTIATIEPLNMDTSLDRVVSLHEPVRLQEQAPLAHDHRFTFEKQIGKSLAVLPE